MNCYLIQQNKVAEKISIGDQASKHYLYGKDQFIEKSFQRLEGAAQEVISKVVDHGPKSVSMAENNVVQEFFLFQFTRTPRQASYANEALTKGMRELFRNHPEFGKKVDSLEVEYEQPYEQMFNMTIDLQGVLSDLKLGVIVAPDSTDFLLGQHPTILTNPYFYKRNWPAEGYGFGCKGIALFLPVDKKHALVLFDRDRLAFRQFGRQCLATSADVDKLNLLQFFYTSNCVYYQNEFDRNYLKQLALETDSFRKSAIAHVIPVAVGNRQGLALNSNAPDFPPEFGFFGFKRKFFGEPFGPTQWDLTRESIRVVLLRQEREREKEKS